MEIEGDHFSWHRAHVPNLGQGTALHAVGDYPIKSWTVFLFLFLFLFVDDDARVRSSPRRALTALPATFSSATTRFREHSVHTTGTRARARRGSRGARRRRRRHVERVREARIRAHGGSRENRGGSFYTRSAFEDGAAPRQGDDALDELFGERGRLRGRRRRLGGGGRGAGGPEGQEAEAGGLGDARVRVGGSQKPKARLRRAGRPAQGLARGTRPALFFFFTRVFSRFLFSRRVFRRRRRVSFSEQTRARGRAAAASVRERIIRSVDDSSPWSLGVKNDARRTHSLAEVRRARRVAAAGVKKFGAPTRGDAAEHAVVRLLSSRNRL